MKQFGLVVLIAGALFGAIKVNQAIAENDKARAIEAKRYEACVMQQWGHSPQWVMEQFGTYPPCK